MNLLQITKKLEALEVKSVPVSEKNAIVVYCDEGDDSELIEAQAKTANPGRLVLVVQSVSVGWQS